MMWLYMLCWKSVLVLALGAAASVGQNCVQTSTCSCRYVDSAELTLIFDVTSLSQGQPIIDQVFGPNSYDYTYQPCLPLLQDNCTTAAICQYYKPTMVYVSVGDYNMTSFVYNTTTEDFTIIYKTRTSSSVTSFVKYICDPLAKEVKPNVIGQAGESGNYYFEITSDKACPTKEYHTTTAIPRAVIEGRINRQLEDLNLSVSSLKTTSLYTAILLTTFFLVAATSLICYMKGNCRQYTKLGV